LGLILGYLGFAEYAQTHGQVRSPWDLAYLVLQLITIESGNVAAPVPWQLVVARMLLPLVTGYAAILTLAALFRDQVQQLTLRFARNHVVICGLGRMGLLLAGECNRTGRRVVVIEIDPANPHIEAPGGWNRSDRRQCLPPGASSPPASHEPVSWWFWRPGRRQRRSRAARDLKGARRATHLHPSDW
jgi:hypothetical protein